MTSIPILKLNLMLVLVLRQTVSRNLKSVRIDRYKSSSETKVGYGVVAGAEVQISRQSVC